MKPFRFRKHPEEPCEFLRRVIRIASTRGSMTSWGQPFEAIASWMLLNMDDRDKSDHRRKRKAKEY